MVMGTYLAVLDNNFNSVREQDTSQSGKYKFAIAWRKPTKKFIARKVYKKKRYNYMKVMMSSTYKRAELGERRKSLKRVMAPKERDTRETIIERAKNYLVSLVISIIILLIKLFSVTLFY